MSLEVDSRHQEPLVAHEEQPEKYVAPGPEYAFAQDAAPFKYGSSAQAPQSKRSPRFGPASLLILSLAVALIAAIIGVGVAASLAVKRQNRINDLLNPSSPNHAQLAECGGGSTPTTAATSSATTPSSTSAAAACTPTRDCTTLHSPFTPANATSPSSSTYTLHCSTDYPGGDLQAVYATTFEQCMTACVTLNAVSVDENNGTSGDHCYAVSYDTTMTILQGNCFLKGRGNLQPVAKDITDSAMLQAS